MVKSEWNANDLNEALQCRLFQGCGEKAVRAYLEAAGVSVYDFSGGEEIPSGLRERCWGLVLLGSVRLFSGGEDGAVLLNVVGRHEVFDIAALTGRREGMPLCSAVTAGRCRIAFVGAGDIGSLMKDHPAIAANCFHFFTGRIAFLNRRIHTLSCGSAEGKLSDFLLSEFQQEENGFTVKLKSCVELANRLNISRASLYRALGTLESAGVIARSGKQITILDMEKLQINSECGIRNAE